MIKQKSLPVLNCNDCGVCCMEQAALPVSWYTGAVRFGDPSLLPRELLIELEMMRDCFLASKFPPDGSPCVWYDETTKRCRHYEYRPEICRELTVGSESCLVWRNKFGISK